MAHSQYAVAVDTGNNLFEVFDLIVLEQETEIDNRYSKNIDKKSKAMHVNIFSDIAIGSVWNGNNFILPENTDPIIFDNDHQELYVFLNNDIVFGFVSLATNTYQYDKYNAAFDSDVIIVKAKNNKHFQLGDIIDVSIL